MFIYVIYRGIDYGIHIDDKDATFSEFIKFIREDVLKCDQEFTIIPISVTKGGEDVDFVYLDLKERGDDKVLDFFGIYIKGCLIQFYFTKYYLSIIEDMKNPHPAQ